MLQPIKAILLYQYFEFWGSWNYAPEFIKVFSDVRIAENGRAMFDCVLIGSPRPKVFLRELKLQKVNEPTAQFQSLNRCVGSLITRLWILMTLSLKIRQVSFLMSSACHKIHSSSIIDLCRITIKSVSILFIY